MSPAHRTSRVDDAYLKLKHEIRSNRLPPGFQATEPEIALRMGMSRTPVREALIRLESEGLLELIPRRGARVLPVSAKDMREIYELFTSLEPDAAAAVAARNPDSDALVPLANATEAMERSLERDDLEAWAEADDRFHGALLVLHGNQRLKAFVSSLYDQAHRARMITLRLRSRPVQSTHEHREILEALKAADGEKARRIFREHRERAARELLAILESYGLPQL